MDPPKTRSILKINAPETKTKPRYKVISFHWLKTNAIFIFIEAIFSTLAFIINASGNIRISCVKGILIDCGLGYVFLTSVLLYSGYVMNEPASINLEMIYHITSILVSGMSLCFLMEVEHSDCVVTAWQKCLVTLFFIIPIVHIFNIIGVCGCKEDNCIFRYFHERQKRKLHPTTRRRSSVSSARRVTFHHDHGGDQTPDYRESSTVYFELPKDEQRRDMPHFEKQSTSQNNQV